MSSILQIPLEAWARSQNMYIPARTSDIPFKFLHDSKVGVEPILIMEQGVIFLYFLHEGLDIFLLLRFLKLYLYHLMNNYDLHV